MSVDPVNIAPVDVGGALQDGDEAAFQIDTWAAKHSLTQKTVKVLRKEDHRRHWLCLLDNDDIDSLGLSFGQRKIFKKSLESQSGPTNGVTSPAHDNPPNTNTAAASATTISDIRNQDIIKEAVTILILLFHNYRWEHTHWMRPHHINRVARMNPFH